MPQYKGHAKLGPHLIPETLKEQIENSPLALWFYERQEKIRQRQINLRNKMEELVVFVEGNVNELSNKIKKVEMGAVEMGAKSRRRKKRKPRFKPGYCAFVTRNKQCPKKAVEGEHFCPKHGAKCYKKRGGIKKSCKKHWNFPSKKTRKRRRSRK